MIKRFTWLCIGFVLGLGSSWAITRKVRRTVARYAPADVRERWSDNVQGLRRDVSSAVTEGREAMRQREAELRAEFPEPGQRVAR